MVFLLGIIEPACPLRPKGGNVISRAKRMCGLSKLASTVHQGKTMSKNSSRGTLETLCGKVHTLKETVIVDIEKF